jgi:hypothetical protein
MGNINLLLFFIIFCKKFIFVLINRAAIIYDNRTIIWAGYQKLIICLFYFFRYLNVFILWYTLNCIFFLWSYIFLNWWLFLIRLKLLWLIHLRIFEKITARDELRFLTLLLSIVWMNIILTSLLSWWNHKEFNFIDLLRMIIISLVQNSAFLKIPENYCSIIWSRRHVPIAFAHLDINNHVTMPMKRCL